MTAAPEATPDVLADMDAACDYLNAAFMGAPVFAEVVAATHGPRVGRGLSALLVFLISHAADETEKAPSEIVETIRDTYARPGGAA